MITKHFPPEFKDQKDGFESKVKEQLFYHGVAYHLMKNLKVEYDYSDGSMRLRYEFSEKDFLDGKVFKGELFFTEQQMKEASEKMEQEEFKDVDPYTPVLNDLILRNIAGAKKVLIGDFVRKNKSSKNMRLFIKDTEIKGMNED